MAADSDRICIGSIAGAFGVSGEVRLKSFCAEPTAIADYGPLHSEDGSRSFKITLTRPVAGGLGARLAGVKTKEEADALKGMGLYVDRGRLPKLPDDEFYHADLIGLEARDSEGRVLGKVSAIHNFGASDVIELTRPDGDQVHLAFTRETVPHIHIADGYIIVAVPEDDEDTDHVE